MSNLLIDNPKLCKEWDYKKNINKPNKVASNSHKKAWWVCSKKHSWEAVVASRNNGRGCPYCTNQKVGYGNDLETQFPEIARLLDNDKNSLRASEILPKSEKKMWWKCKNGHTFENKIHQVVERKYFCLICEKKIPSPEYNLKILYKELMKEWDFTKNKKNPENYLPTSEKKVYWLCKKNHSWQTSIDKRTRLNRRCPYCSNQKVGYGNDLESLYPNLLDNWDYKKNTILPNEITIGTNKEIWWNCKNNHSFKKKPIQKLKFPNCNYCSKLTASKEFNLKTEYKTLMKEWNYQKNNLKPEEYIPGSHSKVWWICEMNHSWQASIVKRTSGTNCPYCTLTPRSREEVYLLFELKQFFNIDANDHKIKLKRVEDVDIKLANEKVVIEYDGSYWHKDKAERDKTKTKALEKAGWTVVRVREKPLKVLSRKYNVSSKTGEYKETANKVLKKLNQLGYEVKGLDKYLERKTLINKKEAEKYIDKLLKEKNNK